MRKTREGGRKEERENEIEGEKERKGHRWRGRAMSREIRKGREEEIENRIDFLMVLVFSRKLRVAALNYKYFLQFLHRSLIE